jgi:CHAT domain-containing protein/tetratricopeptide (TPR) repeat protein
MVGLHRSLGGLAPRHALWVLALLVLVLSGLPTQAREAGTGGPGSLRRNPAADGQSFNALLKRWKEHRGEGDPRAELALGELVVGSSGGRPADRLWARATLAGDYIDNGLFDRARTLLVDADAEAGSFLIRAITDGGEAGFHKQHALFQLQRSRCLLATRLYRHEETALACSLAVDHARKAAELQRFSGGGQAGADSNVLNALLDRAWADRQASRLISAAQGLEQAAALAASGAPRREATAHFYRVASLMALDEGDRRRALDWARRAVAVWQGADDGSVHTGLLKSRNILQTVLVSSGDWQAANAEFDQVDQITRSNELASAARANLLARALAYSHAGRLQTLRQRLAQATETTRQRLGAEHVETAVSEGLLGASWLAGSSTPAERAEGLRLLAQGSEQLLKAQQRGAMPREFSIEGLAARFVLEQLLRTRQTEASAPEARDSQLAFQVADHLRGSRVQAAIEDAALRSVAQAAGLGELVRREQDARNEMRSLQDLLAGRSGDAEEPPPEGSGGAIRERIAELEAERARLRGQIARAFPAYDALVHPKPPGTAEVIRQLALGEAFVLMLPVEDGVHLWALTWTAQNYRFAALPRERLARAVAALRVSTDFDNGPLKPFDVEAAWLLYRELLSPLEAQLAGARHLIVAGGGVLGTLPFAALLTADPQGKGAADMPWLARRMAVSQVPSAGAWLAIQRLGSAPRPDEALMAWGDPTFTAAGPAAALATRRVLVSRGEVGGPGAAPRYADLPALPETRDELQAIAATLRADAARDLLLGPAATRASVLASNRSGTLARKRVVAFATHGLMAGDLPNLDQPALALAATPEAERDPLAPLLKLDDVLALKLNADWVVLSACNTAAADGKAEEALSGLARGFFYAGARSVLVTQWAVETESAKLLTTRTFEHYTANPYAGKAESLRQAMLSVMAMPRYQHPAFWAPYALVGDGAR